MATNWLTARAAIASIIGAVSITAPVAMSVRRVHETQPDAIADWPCVVISGASMRVVRGSSGTRIKTYEVRLQLVARDADVRREEEILQAFSEAMVNAFDAKTRLGLADNYHVVEGPNWHEPGRLELGGVGMGGMEGTLIVEMKDVVTFGA